MEEDDVEESEEEGKESIDLDNDHDDETSEDGGRRVRVSGMNADLEGCDAAGDWRFDGGTNEAFRRKIDDFAGDGDDAWGDEDDEDAGKHGVDDTEDGGSTDVIDVDNFADDNGREGESRI